MKRILLGYMNDNYVHKKTFIKRLKPIAAAYLDKANIAAGLDALELSKDTKHLIIPIEHHFEGESLVSTFPYIKKHQSLELWNIKLYFEQITTAISELHHITNINVCEFDEVAKLNFFYQNIGKALNDYSKEKNNVENIFNKIKKQYELVLCHNDLNEHNFLISKGLIRLFDYDSIGLNTKIFDYVSFIIETLTLNDQYTLAKQYVAYLLQHHHINEDDIDTINDMFHAQNYLWSLWANYFFHREGKKIFKHIANKLFADFSSNKKVY